MKQVKEFINRFLELEASALSNDTVPDLEKLNASVSKMQALIYENISKGFSPKLKTKLKSKIFYSEPIVYTPRYLFKLSSYNSPVYGDLWVAYSSVKNPKSRDAGVSEGFIISEIEGELKVIGVMSVALNQSSMEPSHWKGSVYNPDELNIKDLGKFVATERYREPKDDGFSMEDYLAEK